MTGGGAGAAAQAAPDVVFVARRGDVEAYTLRERLELDVIHGVQEILRPDVYRVPGG
jgi:uncharacterized spore protein YtfJ